MLKNSLNSDKKTDDLKINSSVSKLISSTKVNSPNSISRNGVIVNPTKLHAFRKYSLMGKTISSLPRHDNIDNETESNSIIFADVNNNGVKLTTFYDFFKNKEIKKDYITGGLEDRNLTLTHRRTTINQSNTLNDYINNVAERLGNDRIYAILNRNTHDNIYFEVTSRRNDRLVIAIYDDELYNNECMHITCIYNSRSYVHLTFFLDCNGGRPYHIYYMANPHPNSFMDELIDFIHIVSRDLFGTNIITENFWDNNWLGINARDFNNMDNYMQRIMHVLEFYRDNN